MEEKIFEVHAVGKKALVLRTSEPDKSPGGLYIPPSKDEPLRGFVVSVGKEFEGDLKENDRVYFYTNEFVTVGGTEYAIVTAPDVLCLIREK